MADITVQGYVNINISVMNKGHESHEFSIGVDNLPVTAGTQIRRKSVIEPFHSAEVEFHLPVKPLEWDRKRTGTGNNRKIINCILYGVGSTLIHWQFMLQTQMEKLWQQDRFWCGRCRGAFVCGFVLARVLLPLRLSIRPIYARKCHWLRQTKLDSTVSEIWNSASRDLIGLQYFH